MRITLLGHEDIASVVALNTVVHLCPEHDYRVHWSGTLSTATSTNDGFAELNRIDRKLFERYVDKLEADSPFLHAKPLPSPNDADGLDELSAWRPNLIVSIRYRRILRDAAIAIPTNGVLNLHSGVLPDYRGVMATFWAMLNGEAEIGTTLHWIVDAGIDTGPVIATTRQPLDPARDYLDNVLSLYPAGCRAMAQAIEKVATGSSPTGSKDPGDTGAYYSAPTTHDLRIFEAAGNSLVDSNEQTYLRHLSHLTSAP